MCIIDAMLLQLGAGHQTNKKSNGPNDSTDSHGLHAINRKRFEFRLGLLLFTIHKLERTVATIHTCQLTQ